MKLDSLIPSYPVPVITPYPSIFYLYYKRLVSSRTRYSNTRCHGRYLTPARPCSLPTYRNVDSHLRPNAPKTDQIKGALPSLLLLPLLKFLASTHSCWNHSALARILLIRPLTTSTSMPLPPGLPKPLVGFPSRTLNTEAFRSRALRLSSFEPKLLVIRLLIMRSHMSMMMRREKGSGFDKNKVLYIGYRAPRFHGDMPSVGKTFSSLLSL